MTYQESIEYIKVLQNLGSKPGLSRITDLIKLLDNPHEELKIIHVTGTNGKGSVCAMIEAVLREAGYKTGRFSSPWIEKINEYISVCGEPIPNDDFAQIITYIKSFADEMENKPTEFEFITAAAFEYFRQKKCDVAVIETGMGGLSDATNFIETPVLSVITNVAHDHANFLGDTIEEIAEHKAGIVKENIPVLFGGSDNTALKIIEKIAEKKKSEFFQTDEPDVISSGIWGSELEYRGIKVKIPLAGECQPQNAATAIDAADILCSQGFKVSDEDIVNGLSKVKWKGRFELLETEPPVIFDGGHNIHGIIYAVASIKKYFGDQKVVFLTGVMADKNYKRMAEILTPLADAVYTVTPDNRRALDAEKYEAIFHEKGVKAIACNTIDEGMKKARNLSKEKNLPLIIIGSLYLYKDIKKKK